VGLSRDWSASQLSPIGPSDLTGRVPLHGVFINYQHFSVLLSKSRVPVSVEEVEGVVMIDEAGALIACVTSVTVSYIWPSL
jgi:hypothetical protein